MADPTSSVKRARTIDDDATTGTDNDDASPNSSTTNGLAMDVAFGVYVSKETFKFNAAHFIAYKGYRERLHGHNYRVGVRLLGHRKINPDGYLIDFTCVKDVTRKICKRLNDQFLCPMFSNVLQISEKENESSSGEKSGDSQISIICEDGSFFSFPLGDVAKLPIVHASAEELAVYLWSEILKLLTSSYLIQRGIHTMEISVAEAPGQEAQFKWPIPTNAKEDDVTNYSLDVRSFITEGKVIPMPCQPDQVVKSPSSCCPSCKDPKKALSAQLEKLAQAINQRGSDNSKLSKEDLEAFLN